MGSRRRRMKPLKGPCGEPREEEEDAGSPSIPAPPPPFIPFMDTDIDIDISCVASPPLWYCPLGPLGGS